LNNLDSRAINFIAYAITPWHANGIDAAIKRLEQEGISLLGDIIISGHKYTGRCISEENFLKHDLIDFIEINDGDWQFGQSGNPIVELFERICELKKNRKYKDYIYVLNAGRLNYKWLIYIHKNYKRGVKFVLLDDGTGGYNGFRGTQKYEVLKRSIYNLFKETLIRQNCFIDNRLFYFDKGRITVKRDIAYYYESVYKSTDKQINEELLKKFESKIIINTQCLYDSKEIEGNQDIETFRQLDKVLCFTGKKERVLVKPHPRELSLDRYSVFGWDFLKECKYTQEEIIAKVSKKPLCVIGLTSSSLVNLNALFDIKTISLAKLFLKTDLPTGMKKDVEDFISLYGDIVEMPESEKDLIYIISKLED